MVLRVGSAFKTDLEASVSRCYPVAMLKTLKNEKPWAILKVSRRQYETQRPWVVANMPRQKFEEFIASLPDGFVDHCHRDAEADRLVEAIFGKVE